MIAGVAALVSGLSCGEAPGAFSQNSGKLQTVSGFRLTQAEEANRTWSLAGDTAVYLEDDSVVTLSGVIITFFRDNLPESVVTADSGRAGLNTGITVLWGSVTAENVRGRRLETDLLEWDDSLGVFYTDCLAVFTVPEEEGVTVLRGRGVTLNTGLGTLGDVTVSRSFQAVYSGEVTGVD